MAKEHTAEALNRDLGEHRSIPRRDLLQGTLVAAATTLAGPLLKAANSDSGGAAYTDSAILQAHRAVNELLQG